jgi:hypothetical protein
MGVPARMSQTGTRGVLLPNKRRTWRARGVEVQVTAVVCKLEGRRIGCTFSILGVRFPAQVSRKSSGGLTL